MENGTVDWGMGLRTESGDRTVDWEWDCGMGNGTADCDWGMGHVERKYPRTNSRQS